jgi:hypothetical protein
MEAKMLVVMEPLENASGIGTSISTQGPLPIFNLVVEFFCGLRQNYQKVRTKELQSLQDLQCKPHESLQEAYARMHRLIIMTQGVIKA